MFAKHNSAQNWCWSSRSAPVSPQPFILILKVIVWLPLKTNTIIYYALKPAIGCSVPLEWNPSPRWVSSIMGVARLRAAMRDRETDGLTEMEVGAGGGPAVSDFLHLTSPLSPLSPLTHWTVIQSQIKTQCCLKTKIDRPVPCPMYTTRYPPLSFTTMLRCLRRVFLTWIMVHIYIYTSVFTAHVNIDLPEINLRRGRLLLPFKDLNNNILLANLTSRTMKPISHLREKPSRPFSMSIWSRNIFLPGFSNEETRKYKVTADTENCDEADFKTWFWRRSSQSKYHTLYVIQTEKNYRDIILFR